MKLSNLMKWTCHWRDIECKRDYLCDGCEMQPSADDKPNGKQAPKPIEWETWASSTYPECPSCGEMPYSLERCTFCGQKFIKDNRAEEWSKPPTVEYMDCPICGGKNTLQYTRARSNGHRHGVCVVCGTNIIE